MSEKLQIKSRTVELFEPAGNPVELLIHAIEVSMNSNVVLIKGEASENIDKDFLNAFIPNHLLDLFYDYDIVSKKYDWHDWFETEESEKDFYKSYKRRDFSFVKSQTYIKRRPISYLAFLEKLHWMLRTSFSPYKTHPDEATALKLISAFSNSVFGLEQESFQTLPKAWQGIPDWIPNAWTFYDVVPNFLYDNGYWSQNDETPDAYFDGGGSDSCTFFYKDNVFYLLLTNGSP